MQYDISNLTTSILLYHGLVTHQRVKPFKHALKYRVFYMLADLDALPDITQKSRWLSFNRWNIFSFHEKDHARRDGQPIRPWLEDALREKNMSELIGGRIRVLCFPRMFGYVFNPLTIYYIHHPKTDALSAIFHEVKNTFGEQHGYLLPIETIQDNKFTQTCDKNFHVSPFIAMQARYHFTLNNPDKKLLVHIHEKDTDGDDLLFATLKGERFDFSDKNLLRLLWRYPLMTLKVMLGIHYEAIHLWRKGAQFFKKPDPPKADFS